MTNKINKLNKASEENSWIKQLCSTATKKKDEAEQPNTLEGRIRAKVGLTHVLAKSDQEPLQKSKKDLLNMAGPNNQDKALWVNEHIAHPPMQTWFLKHAIQKPELFNDQNKETMKHFSGIAGIVPAIRDMQLKGKDFDSAVNQMKSHEKEHFDKQGNLIPVEGQKILDLGNGWSWYDLKKPSCSVHGNAMGHCGNAGDPHQNDTILSLQKIHKFGGKELAEPAVTFINRSGYLTETKGKQNDKPHKKYHKAIVELLKHKKDIVANIGGGYKPENNFNINQLDPSLKQELKAARPDFMDSLSTDAKDRNQLKAIHEQNMKDLDFNEFQRASVFADDATIKNYVKNDPDESAIYLSGRLDQDDLNRLFEYSLNSAGTDFCDAMLGHRYSKDQIDQLVEKHPRTSAEHLSKNPYFNVDHIDKIVEKNPSAAAYYLNEHPLFNADHISKIVEGDPGAAAKYLNEHPFLNIDHINKIVEKAPHYATKYLNQHPLLNVDHINKIIEEDPRSVAYYINKHPLFNADHISKIVDLNEWAASELLNEHPLLNADHISEIVKRKPELAAMHLNEHPLLNADHISEIIEAERGPESVARFLSEHPALNSDHINRIIYKDPGYAAQYLNNHPAFNINHINRLAEEYPYLSAKYLNKHPLLNADHISKIVEGDPGAAASYLSGNPIYNRVMAERKAIKEKKTASECNLLPKLSKSLFDD